MPSALTVTIREGTVADIPEIARQRRRMYEDMNYTDTEALSTMVTLTSEYLKKAVPEGSFRSWLASDNGRVVGGGAVVISCQYSEPISPTTLLNKHLIQERS